MDQLTYLFVLCAAMFLGAFGAGYIPLTFSLSESKLRLVTIFGAGLLVGTALVVIIPEGIAMHYEGQMKHAAAAAAAGHDHGGHGHAHGRRLGESSLGLGGVSEGITMGGDEDITHEHPGHWQIGAALALGFAFQLIVDRLSGGLHGHSHGVALPGSGASSGGEDAAAAAAAATDDSAKSKSAMAGMIVHAAVDGVALGAAVREGDSALGLLVFLAIMLHKAPSSFGLASYLLHHGITAEGVKRRLLLFSSSAPLGAFGTYMLLSMNMFEYKQEMLAICLLFSGGTFLYVATAHVLPEIQAGAHGPALRDEDDGHHHGEAGGHGHSHAPRTPPKMKWSETWLLVSGVLLPLLLDVHHGH